MQKKFVTNLGLVLLLNLLIKPYWIFGIDRNVQLIVGTEQYGFYYAIFSFSFLLNILLDFGITNFNNKNISQNNHLLSKHLSSIIVLRLLLAGVFAIVTFLAGLIVQYNSDMLKMLVAVIFNQILLGFILYLRSNLAGMHLFKTDSIVSVLDRLLMIGICSYLIYMHNHGGEFNITWFVYSQTIAYVITVFITLVVVLKKAKIRRLQWRWPFFVMIMKKSYPYAVLVLLMTFYNWSNGPMLERLLPFRVGANQAGIFASANRLLDAANMIPVLFAGLLLPIFARMIKLKQNVEEMVRLSFSLLVIPAIVVAVCCSCFSLELMDYLNKGNHVQESSDVFKIIIFCFVPVSATYIFGTLLTSNGSLKQLNIMAGTGMIVNIIMNLILIPKFSAVGAAISSITTQTFTALVQVFMANKAFNFTKNYKLIISIVVFIAVSFFINSFAYQLNLFWMIRFAIEAGACFIVAMALRLISVKNIYYILKYGEE
ncbi:MAG: oligosaccharide flippase family protein [Bacteroidota bacterium]